MVRPWDLPESQSPPLGHLPHWLLRGLETTHGSCQIRALFKGWVFTAARGLSLVVVRGLLIVVASLVAEHGL